MEGGRRGKDLTSSSQIPESATNADNRIYSVLCKFKNSEFENLEFKNLEFKSLEFENFEFEFENS